MNFQLNGPNVNALAFSHDGKTLATGTGDWNVTIYDLTTGREKTTLHNLNGHKSLIYSICISPDG